MSKIIISTNPATGIVTFDNFEEVKAGMESFVSTYQNIDYATIGLEAATADRDQLKKVHDIVYKKKKDLEKMYSVPYATVSGMLDELLAIVDGPYKRLKTYVEAEEKAQKRQQIMAYAQQRAASYGTVGSSIVSSPAFFNPEWMLKKNTMRKCQDAVDEILRQASRNLYAIQAIGGEHTPALSAHYCKTLSMESTKGFLTELRKMENEVKPPVNPVEEPVETPVIGYKVLKITATEDQMASILDHLEVMGVEVEEIEDGMPKPLVELTEPVLDSFVAFDIETTGTNGAANGDGEAKITEIGAVRVVNGVITERFDELANPGRPIVPRIARMTHITNAMVADKPPVDEVIRRFHEFVGDSPLVGHNIKSSDLRYIVKAASHAGICFKVPFLDTYILSKKFKSKMGWERVTLSYLSNHFGLEHKEVHRAWSDAEVNAEVYFELQKLWNSAR